jgi:hypothetical protein
VCIAGSAGLGGKRPELGSIELELVGDGRLFRPGDIKLVGIPLLGIPLPGVIGRGPAVIGRGGNICGGLRAGAGAGAGADLMSNSMFQMEVISHYIIYKYKKNKRKVATKFTFVQSAYHLFRRLLSKTKSRLLRVPWRRWRGSSWCAWPRHAIHHWRASRCHAVGTVRLLGESGLDRPTWIGHHALIGRASRPRLHVVLTLSHVVLALAHVVLALAHAVHTVGRRHVGSHHSLLLLRATHGPARVRRLTIVVVLLCRHHHWYRGIFVPNLQSITH